MWWHEMTRQYFWVKTVSLKNNHFFQLNIDVNGYLVVLFKDSGPNPDIFISTYCVIVYIFSCWLP